MAQSKPRNYKLHQDLMGCKGGAMKNKRDKLAHHQRKEHDQDMRDLQSLRAELKRDGVDLDSLAW